MTRRTPSVLRALLCGALLCGACGNYSNEDLAFLAALPEREALRLVVPSGAAQPLCALGESSAWRGARDTGASINSAIDALLGLVDLIRTLSPTSRAADARAWGPFPDSGHPGLESRVTMQRQRGATARDDAFTYAFEQRRGGGAWLPVVSGAFLGASARGGSGTMVLHFDAAWTLGTTKPDDPRGDAVLGYDHTSDPRTLELELRASGGFGLKPSFRYSYAGYLDGHGRFDFFVVDPRQNELTIAARFTAQGAGLADLAVRTPAGLTGHVEQCWDPLSCLTWLDDPLGITQPACGELRPCTMGASSACPPEP